MVPAGVRIASTVEYATFNEGVRTPERPMRKFAPSRGWRANPADWPVM
jgi:hypothetical protein